MAIPTTIESLSVTAASNGPSGSDQLSTADDGLRQAYAFIRQLVNKGSDIASATTITPPSNGSVFAVTGTTAITTIASTNSWDGRVIYLVFAAALTFTHGSNLALPGSANITTAANDIAVLVQTSSGVWRLTSYIRSDGFVVAAAGSASLPGVSFAGDANNGWWAPAADTQAWSLSGTELMRLNSTGLGVGVTPTSRLDVSQAGANVAARIRANAGFSGVIQLIGNNTSAGVTSFDIQQDSSGNADIVQRSNARMSLYTNNTERLRVTEDGRIYGTALHNNAGAVTGTSTQYIASGTYTPTLTSVTNVTSSSASECQWMRVGNVVTVSGIVQCTPTAAGNTNLGVSLPIASNFASASDCAGSFNTQGTVLGSLYADADTTNDRLNLNGTATVSAAANLSFVFMYEVK